MSLRCFWLISTSTKSLLYNRTFVAIEAKAKANGLTPLPIISSPEDEFILVKAVLSSLGVQFQEDSNTSNDSSATSSLNNIPTRSLERSTIPALEINFKDLTIWPLIVCEQLGLLYCALPLIELPNEGHLVDHLPVSVTFAFLQQVMSFYNSNHSLYDLDELLAALAPLGRYIGLLPIPVSSERKQEDLVISITIQEKVSHSLAESKDKVFGSIFVETARRANISTNTKASINLLIRDMANMVVAMSPGCLKSTDESISVNLSRKEVQTIHYWKPNHDSEPFIAYSYEVWKLPQSSDLYKVQLVISLGRKFSQNKLKFAFFNVIWRESFKELYKPSNVHCTHGQVVTGVNNELSWTLGSKLPRTSKAVFSCDITTNSGLGDQLLAFCCFKVEDWTMAATISKECITVTDGFPPSTKVSLGKSTSSVDYRLKWNLVPTPSE